MLAAERGPFTGGFVASGGARAEGMRSHPVHPDLRSARHRVAVEREWQGRRILDVFTIRDADRPPCAEVSGCCMRRSTAPQVARRRRVAPRDGASAGAAAVAGAARRESLRGSAASFSPAARHRASAARPGPDRHPKSSRPAVSRLTDIELASIDVCDRDGRTGPHSWAAGDLMRARLFNEYALDPARDVPSCPE
jgi:hypothetical protein